MSVTLNRSLAPDLAVVSRPGPDDAISELCGEHGVVISRSASRGWILRAVPSTPDELGALLACIDEVLTGFEVMQISGGFRWSTFDTLAEAVADAVEIHHLDPEPL